MRAIAIDDEPLALEVIRLFASKVPQLEVVGYFTDAFKAIEYLQQEPVDLLFLDINMPALSGLEFVSCLPEKPFIVFTTAYAEHAVQSFELDAVDYLLKPYSLVRFLKACNKAQDLLRQHERVPVPRNYIFLKTGYDLVKVDFTHVLYMEAAGNYVNIVLEDKRLLARTSIGELSELLPSAKFARVHRSYIISIDKIDRIERHQVCIQGKYVPVGNSYMPQLLEMSQNNNASA